jgi:dihydroorotate dehydrogenase
MSFFYKNLLRPLLFLLDAEDAHALSFSAIAAGNGMLLPWVAQVGAKQNPYLLAGIQFPNRIGLAAGFDKNALLINQWHKLGFGHVEVGTVTPRGQSGNPKPRLFRLPKDAALINRMGFNNEGAEAIRRRLEAFRQNPTQLIIGGNIGKNKDTSAEDAPRDYLLCMEALHTTVDYFTVNISSPNTPGLRDLQAREPLWRLLGELQNLNHKLGKPRPIFLKLAPDLADLELADLALVAQECSLAGLVVTNTTTARNNLLTNPGQVERMGNGGLSGLPLQERSQRFCQIARKLLPAEMAIIASGGIMSAIDAKARFAAGADLIQLYTGFVYEGPELVGQINNLSPLVTD